MARSRASPHLPIALSLRRYAPTALDRQLRYAIFSVLAIVAAMDYQADGWTRARRVLAKVE